MKSIKSKLLVPLTVIVLVLIVGIGFVTTNIVSKDILNSTNEHLVDMAVQEAQFIGAKVEADVSYIAALAQNQIITSEDVDIDKQILFFEAEAKRSGFLLFGYSDVSGNATTLTKNKETLDISDRDFFKRALEGENVSSDLIFSSLDGKPALVFASPVYRNGKIAGVLYGRKDGLILSEIVKDLKYKKTGYAYMVNNEGVTVAHKNIALVIAQDNDIENMKTDPALVGLGELTKRMITRDVGSGDYTYYGVSKICGFAPIENTPWIVIFGVEESEVLSAVHKMKRVLMTIFIAAMAIGVLLMYFVSASISKPIKNVTIAAREIAEGNFDVTLSVNSKDEVAQLAEAFNLTVRRLNNYQGYIDEISEAMSQIAQGNLKVTLEKEYEGQFKKLKDSLEALMAELRTTLTQFLIPK